MPEAVTMQQNDNYTTTHNSTYQNLRLHEWIERGRESGSITDVNTVLLAYCMDEHDALAWIADIVDGRTSETDALIFMERALKVTH